MKMLTYLHQQNAYLAALIGDRVYDMEELHTDLPDNMTSFLQNWEENLLLASIGERLILEGKRMIANSRSIDDVQLLAPVPFPTSLRDGYAFRQHVETARRNRQAAMLPEFDQFPVFLLFQSPRHFWGR